jgi:hypothetical protein
MHPSKLLDDRQLLEVKSVSNFSYLAPSAGVPFEQFTADQLQKLSHLENSHSIQSK